MARSETVLFNPAASWALSERVSLRDEAFGALAYHHGTRRLVFLKSRELVTLVRSLEDFESADLAINAVVEPAQHARYVVALSSLAASEILSER
jgi:putative mycofactocin binding protein MftB